MDRFRLRVGIILILLVNTIFSAIITKTDSILVRENAHIEKLLMLDVTNEAMEADSILVKATDNYICNFPILNLPFFTESEIDSILLGKSDTGHVHDTSDVTGLHNMLAGKEPSLGTGDNMSTLRGSDKTWAPVTSMLSLNPPSAPDQYYKYNGSQFVWSDIPISDVTNLQDALELKLDVTELDNFYTKTQLQTSGQASVHADNITNVPWLTSLPSHDHDTRYPLKSLGWVRAGYTYEAMETDRVTLVDGLYTYSWYSNALNRPSECDYGSALTFGGLGNIGKGQLLVGWGPGTNNYLAFRSLRDAVDDWYPLKRIYHEGYKPKWDDIDSKPAVFPPESHNHSASDINSGTLSNDRLSFNPDYFVQGANSFRMCNFDNSTQLDNNIFSTFLRLAANDPSSPDNVTNYYGIRSAYSSEHTIEIIGRANSGNLYFGGLYYGVRQPWRKIWHSGNLDTANIAKLDADNVFTGVNTFSDTVKVARLKPVNSNFIRIDLGQDGKNYGANFRHIDADYSEGAIGMYAKSYFDIKSDGLMQLISGEKVHIEGGDSVSISKNANTIKMLMTTDNKVTIGKVQDTVLPLQRNSIDSLVVGRKYGGAYLVMGGESGPSISGYNNDFQAAPSLAGNLTYTATKHNFNGNIVYGGNPSIIHSEYENIGFNSLTLNPTKGVYICGGSTTGQEIILGTSGVENGQTVKILKISNLLAGVRYGEPNHYYWRSIGHYGAAEFIHYNGVWLCLGTDHDL